MQLGCDIASILHRSFWLCASLAFVAGDISFHGMPATYDASHSKRGKRSKQAGMVDRCVAIVAPSGSRVSGRPPSRRRTRGERRDIRTTARASPCCRQSSALHCWRRRRAAPSAAFASMAPQQPQLLCSSSLRCSRRSFYWRPHQRRRDHYYRCCPRLLARAPACMPFGSSERARGREYAALRSSSLRIQLCRFFE